jgi:ABC-type polysaccharide/polyol phosphate transport system ATPase subunit
MSSASSSILFHDVVANVDGINVANKISFKLEKGDRVALTGSNQEGHLFCEKFSSFVFRKRRDHENAEGRIKPC